MCAVPNTTTQSRTTGTSGSSTFNTQSHLTSNPKKSKPSHGGKNVYMQRQQGNSALPQKPKPQSTRNEKRARWAKKNRLVPKPAVKRGPVKEYISACCSLPATKPPCGTKESMKDPETGKMKDRAKGLGHFRCSGCRKVCKVTPRKPQPKETLTVEAPVATPAL